MCDVKDMKIVIVWNGKDVGIVLQLVSQLHSQPEFAKDGEVENDAVAQH